MGRPPRLVADGLVYHAINRGNDRTAVFFESGDHLAFLESLRQTKERYPFQLFGYCLIGNHYHLVLQTRVRVNGLLKLTTDSPLLLTGTVQSRQKLKGQGPRGEWEM